MQAVVVRAARQNSAPRLGLSAAVPPGPRLGSTSRHGTRILGIRTRRTGGRAAGPGRGKYLLYIGFVYTHLIHIYLPISLEVRISLEVHLLFYTYLLSTYLIFYQPNTQLSLLSLFCDMDSLVIL